MTRLKRIILKICRWFGAHWIEVIVTVTGFIMLVGLALMLNAVSHMSQQISKVHKMAAEARMDAHNAENAQATLLENSELNRRQWELLRQHNPELAVPQVVQESTAPESAPTPEHSSVIVSEKKLKPSPSPKIIVKPGPIRYKKVPTTFWDIFKAHPTPKPTPTPKRKK